jgi:hypothetical protein
VTEFGFCGEIWQETANSQVTLKPACLLYQALTQQPERSLGRSIAADLRIGTLRCFAGLSLLNTQTFLRKAVCAKGRISNIFEVIPAGDCVFPSRIVTVQFWTEQEESIAFQSPTFQGNPETIAGSIPVLYDPNRPAEAKIHSFEGLWLTSELVMVLGAGFSLLFANLFLSVLR